MVLARTQTFNTDIAQYSNLFFFTLEDRYKDNQNKKLYVNYHNYLSATLSLAYFHTAIIRQLIH